MYKLVKLLRVTTIAVAMSLGLMTSPQAQGDPIEAIQNVIRQQVEHFNDDNAAGAFAIAAPSIQEKFGTPERFLQLVAKGYPQIYRAQSLKFLTLKPHYGSLIQRVLVRDSADRISIAAYAMVRVEGDWRIAGCWMESGTKA